LGNIGVAAAFIETHVTTNKNFSCCRVIATIGFAAFVIANKDSSDSFRLQSGSFCIRDMTISDTAKNSKMTNVRPDPCVHFFWSFQLDGFRGTPVLDIVDSFSYLFP
jgi:hypothetical protein